MKSKASIVLVVILVFLLGGIAGAVCHSLYQEYLKAAFIKANSQTFDFIGNFAEELDLDAQQTETLKVIFDESRQHYIDLSMEIWPQYEKIRKETEQKIKDMLRDDQRARYEVFLKQFQPPPQYQEIGQGNGTETIETLRDNQRAHYEVFLKKFRTPPFPGPRGN